MDEKNIEELNKKDPEFCDRSRTIYYFSDNKRNLKVGGYYRTSITTPLNFLTVTKSGHFVPIGYLEATKTLVKDYASQQKLLCHSSDCEIGPIQCKYTLNCSNHGTCSNVTGQCNCQEGWIGGDCRSKLTILTNNFN